MAPDWSPSGSALVVDGLLLHLESGSTCRLPDNSRFVSENELVAATRGPLPDRLTEFTLYDLHCNPGKRWTTQERWNILDISVARQLLLIKKHLVENLLVDPEMAACSEDGRSANGPYGWPERCVCG